MSMRLLDPPTRKGWIRQLSPRKAATALIREYLTSRVGVPDSMAKDMAQAARRAESAACKSMLRAHTEANRIPMAHAGDVELGIVPGDRQATMLIVLYVPGVRSLVWAPRLSTPTNAKLVQIKRETGLNRVIINEEPKAATTDKYGDTPTRSGFPPKGETRFIPGRRT